VSEQDEIVIGGDAEDIPEGIYPGKLDTIEVRPGVQFEGDFRIWTFVLDNGSTVSGTSSTATSSRAKSYKWIKALLGRKPETGEKVKLAGLPCQVRVEHDAEGWPRVTDVLPPAAKAAAAIPPDAAVAATTSDDLPF
jgi:hypothetical protein